MMKGKDDVTVLTVEQLVAAFAEAGIAQAHADLYGKYSVYNRLYRKIEAIQSELKSRAGDQRSALVALLDHPNPQVRYMAAEFTLAVAPAASRQALKDLSDKNIYPQAADARGTLWSLEAGRRKPT
jgi:hypothetical protein